LGSREDFSDHEKLGYRNKPKKAECDGLFKHRACAVVNS